MYIPVYSYMMAIWKRLIRWWLILSLSLEANGNYYCSLNCSQNAIIDGPLILLTIHSKKTLAAKVIIRRHFIWVWKFPVTLHSY